MNSTRVHYLQLTCQQLQAEQKKKKKKAEIVDAQHRRAIQTAPKWCNIV